MRAVCPQTQKTILRVWFPGCSLFRIRGNFVLKSHVGSLNDVRCPESRSVRFSEVLGSTVLQIFAAIEFFWMHMHVHTTMICIVLYIYTGYSNCFNLAQVLHIVNTSTFNLWLLFYIIKRHPVFLFAPSGKGHHPAKSACTVRVRVLRIRIHIRYTGGRATYMYTVRPRPAPSPPLVSYLRVT